MNILRPLSLAAPLAILAIACPGIAPAQPIPGVSARYGGIGGGILDESLLPTEDGSEIVADPGDVIEGLEGLPGAAVGPEAVLRGPIVPYEPAPPAIVREAAELPQEPRIEFVDERVREGLEPLGVRAGSFLFFPEVEGTIEHTDNVFASGTDPVGDFVFVLRPALVARSDWNRHALELRYAGEYGKHVEFSSEDQRETALQATGRLDVTQATALAGQARFTAEQEGRGDIEVADTASEPTRKRTYAAAAEASHRISRATLALRAGLVVEDYDNSTDALGAVINNDDRDATETEGGFRLAYEISPATSVFSDVSLGARRYDQTIDDDGFARDADRWAAKAGVALEPTPLIRAELAVGRIVEDLDDPRLETIDEVTVDAALEWSVTPLTTLSAGYETTVDATTLADASGAVARTASVGVAHELLRELVITSGVAWEVTDYPGVTLEEETIEAEVGAEYWMSRNAALVARYTYEDQTSNDETDPGSVENTIAFGIKLRR